MTKVSKPALLSDDVQAPVTPATPTVQAVNPQKPYYLTINELSHKAFAQAAVHIKQGYRFIADQPPEILPPFGHTIIRLELGEPEQFEIAAAAVTTAQALALQHAAYLDEVAAEARRIVAAEEKAKQQAVLDAEIAVQRAALARLVSAAAAL